MNKIAGYLQKDPVDFTRDDLVRYIESHDIHMLNFRYVGGDGRLKTLNFVINSRRHLHDLLATGERVDGSSLFSYIPAEFSDLYVIPRYRTAFENPFAEERTLDILCSFFDGDGVPLTGAPESLLHRAHSVLQERTGFTLEALGELEFYLFSEVDPIYGITPQRGYHESHPFSKWGMIRREAMKVIADLGGMVKYGHAEVGNIIHSGQEMVQHEIEFLPVPIEDAADQLVIAKWVVREVAYKHGLTASFAPKIIVGHAGSGLHIHSRLMRNGHNAMRHEGALSEAAKRLIAGYLDLAPSLSAFGNTVPTSFLRLVPHQEAPTSICWGDKNRQALVRVPIGWHGASDMVFAANPNEPRYSVDTGAKQTVELRSADGSANVHHLMAGLAVAARHGIEDAGALSIAERTYVAPGTTPHGFEQLPVSCYETADRLLDARQAYEAFDVFPPALLDDIAMQLRSFDDRDLSERHFGDAERLRQVVEAHLHCG